MKNWAITISMDRTWSAIITRRFMRMFCCLPCSFLSLGLLLGESLSPCLVYFGLCLDSCLGLVGCSLAQALLLGLDLGVSLSFPVSELLVSLLLGECTFGNTAVKMLPEEAFGSLTGSAV